MWKTILGLQIDGELSVDKHVGTNVSKANATFGVLRGNFQYLNHKTFILLYKALVNYMFLLYHLPTDSSIKCYS